MLPIGRWVRWLVLGWVLLGLWSCGGPTEVPPQAVVERAIALRMAHVQQQLITHLAPTTPQTPNFRLKQVTVTRRQPLQTPENTYQVNGTYEAIIQLPSRQSLNSGDFELYIRAESDSSTEPAATRWYLAEPSDTGWQTTALDL
ncbi:MAG: hypothetical protein AAFQ61_12270 [Cyanobacteria bacterium J06626_23]